MTTKKVIAVKDTAVTVISQNETDYISLTDITRYRDAQRTDYIIQNWMRNRNTIEFLGIWESLNNAGFKPIEFDGFRKQAGLNSFTLTAKQWIEKTGAIGLVSKQGRYGGTFAHKDIAFEFASWISVEFKLYLIKEFQRLKEDENSRLSLAWNLNRTSHPFQAELSHSHRRHQIAIDPGAGDGLAGRHYLRQRSGYSQRRTFWPDGKAMAKRQS
jgi:KilA-N domain